MPKRNSNRNSLLQMADPPTLCRHRVGWQTFLPLAHYLIYTTTDCESVSAEDPHLDGYAHPDPNRGQ